MSHFGEMERLDISDSVLASYIVKAADATSTALLSGQRAEIDHRVSLRDILMVSGTRPASVTVDSSGDISKDGPLIIGAAFGDGDGMLHLETHDASGAWCGKLVVVSGPASADPGLATLRGTRVFQRAEYDPTGDRQANYIADLVRIAYLGVTGFEVNPPAIPSPGSDEIRSLGRLSNVGHEFENRTLRDAMQLMLGQAGVSST